MEPRTEEELFEYRCETARIERKAAIVRLAAAQEEHANAIAAGELQKMAYQQEPVGRMHPALNMLGTAGLANKGH